VIFESLQMLAPQGQTSFRVAALGQLIGDQRVRATVASDQVRSPATREQGVRVYRD
jgi:hypothetical protein